MKIVHLISQHPESTGSGVYLQHIIRQAAAAGHDSFLIAGMTGERTPELPGIPRNNCRFLRFSSHREGDLPFAVPGMSNVMPYPSCRFDSLSAGQLTMYEEAFAGAVRSAAADFAPDILHSHHLWLASSVVRRVLPDIPMVTSCHSTDLRQFVQCSQLGERVLAHCRRIDRVLALSRDQQERICQIYGIDRRRIDIVGGGYDDRLFAPGVKPQAPPVHLLYAGKLSFAKGVDWLLRTFIDMDDPRLHLHLAGSGTGEEAQLCLRLAEEAGSSVTVHGRISQEDLAQLMGRCHIFILPSFYEGLPLVLFEALAAGCRIVATDLPGSRELLAEAGLGLVRFVKLPVLAGIDHPAEGDAKELRSVLAAAIRDMAGRVLTEPPLLPQDLSAITSAYGWRTVFGRIVESYERAMAG